MTKKDYAKLASAVYRAHTKQAAQWSNEAGIAAVADVIDALCDVLAADNPAFNRQAFIAACVGAK